MPFATCTRTPVAAGVWCPLCRSKAVRRQSDICQHAHRTHSNMPNLHNAAPSPGAPTPQQRASACMANLSGVTWCSSNPANAVIMLRNYSTTAVLQYHSSTTVPQHLITAARAPVHRQKTDTLRASSLCHRHIHPSSCVRCMVV
jgi:hypothetical protein